MSELKLEYTTIRAQYEILNSEYRAGHKLINAEMKRIENFVTKEIDIRLNLNYCTKDFLSSIQKIIEDLNKMKTKVNNSLSKEITAAESCKKRCNHLIEYPVKERGSKQNDYLLEASLFDWKRIRLNRMIVEHFLTCGYYESAKLVAEKTNVYDLTNYGILEKLKFVEKDLAEHKTNQCFEWVEQNKEKLKKINSKMEFELHVQNFIELNRSDKQEESLEYAKKYLKKYFKEYIEEVSRCMVLLTFAKDHSAKICKDYFKSSRWNDLINYFRTENYRLYKMPKESIFSIVFQIGISALKTPQCYSESSKNHKCPVCQDEFNQIGKILPFSQRDKSYLICRVTGLPINENNLPIILPNGQVYSKEALKKIMRITTEGVIETVCPVTSQVFHLDDEELEKIYII